MKRLIADSTSVSAAVISLSLASVGSAAMVSVARLRAEALSVGQMPAGWTASAPRRDPRLGCLASLLEPKGVKETHRVQVFHLGRRDLPLFDETMTTHSSVTLAYKKTASTIARCCSVAGERKGYPVKGIVRRLSAPRHGSASVAFSISLAAKHITVKVAYLIVRKVSVILGILKGSCPSVNLSQLRGLAAKAVAKIK